MAVTGGVPVTLGTFMAMIGPELLRHEPDMTVLQMRIMGVVYGVAGLPAMTLFLIGILAPRGLWTRVYRIVAICRGMLNCCAMVRAIISIIYWARPENQTYFSRLRD